MLIPDPKHWHIDVSDAKTVRRNDLYITVTVPTYTDARVKNAMYVRIHLTE